MSFPNYAMISFADSIAPIRGDTVDAAKAHLAQAATTSGVIYQYPSIPPDKMLAAVQVQGLCSVWGRYVAIRCANEGPGSFEAIRAEMPPTYNQQGFLGPGPFFLDLAPSFEYLYAYACWNLPLFAMAAQSYGVESLMHFEPRPIYPLLPKPPIYLQHARNDYRDAGYDLAAKVIAQAPGAPGPEVPEFEAPDPSFVHGPPYFATRRGPATFPLGPPHRIGFGLFPRGEWGLA